MDRAFILDTIESSANYYALPIERTRDLIDLERNPLIVTKRYQLVARRGTPENPPVLEHVVERPHIHCIVEREGQSPYVIPLQKRLALSFRDIAKFRRLQELYAACCSPLCTIRSRRPCGESVVRPTFVGECLQTRGRRRQGEPRASHRENRNSEEAEAAGLP